MSRRSDAPGLSVRQNKSGAIYYWVARDVARNIEGFEPKTVRLHYNTDEGRAARCRALATELRVWLAGQRKRGLVFDGSLASLIECYQRDEDSPYHGVKWNTRRHYDQTLDLLQGMFGTRHLTALTGRDFARWYRALKEPRNPGGPERIARAHNCMKMLRVVIRYGAAVGHPKCASAAGMLSFSRFALPAPRKVAMSFSQAKAVIDQALERGRPSIALAQALQFELSLRQRDVIGEWVDHDGAGGIAARGKRWTGGVVWSDIDADMILRKATTKTGALGEWDLTRCPLVMSVLAAFEPLTERVGPLIIDEPRDRPYFHRNFSRHWRAIADAAGVPGEVWNMDSRAGGITEGADAGATVDDLRLHATHSNQAITTRYVRGALDSTRRVADLRAARRAKSERSGNKVS